MQHNNDHDTNAYLVQRRTVHFNTLQQLYTVTLCMFEHTTSHVEKQIPYKALRDFPHVFAGNNNSKFQKASRWWAQKKSSPAENKWQAHE